MMDDPVSPNRLVAGTTETPKFPKFQSSAQRPDYRVDSVHGVMSKLVSVVACVRPVLDPGWSRTSGWQGGKETFPDKLLPQRKP